MANDHLGPSEEVDHIIMISLWAGFVWLVAVRAAGEDNAR
jgi:hypothetical protein